MSEQCLPCNGTGWVGLKYNQKVCVFCNGRGIREIREVPAAHNADAALREACDWLERLVQHYDPDDTEAGKAEIARLSSALRSPATGEAQ